MQNKGMSRRDFLRISGGASAGALASKLPMPAFARQVGDFDLTDPAQVGEALAAEGAEVSIHSWGFSGLPEPVLIPKFAEYTEKMYGVPVKLNWITGQLGNWMTELPLANRTAADEGLDVIDKEEDGYASLMALEWGEPINLPQYEPLLRELAAVARPRTLDEVAADLYLAAGT